MDAASRNPSQRIVHYRYGDPQDVLRVEDGVVPLPLGAGDVRVRVRRSVIHPGDLQIVAAKYSLAPAEIPEGRVPGSEAVGVVEEAAPGSLDGTGIRIGTRVAFLGTGAWQSEVVVPAASVVAVPDDIADDVAAQMLVNSLTARFVLRIGLSHFSVRPSHLVLTAAASSVGKLVAAAAMHEKLHVVRLVRSAESAARLADVLPGGDIVETASAGWQDEVRRLTGSDVPFVIDGVGGPMIAASTQLLNAGGVLVSFGLLDGAAADLTMFIPKGLTLRGVSMGSWRSETTAELQAEDEAFAVEMVRTHPRVFEGLSSFDLSELPAAISAVTASAKSGNVIIKL